LIFKIISGAFPFSTMPYCQLVFATIHILDSFNF